MTNEAEDRIALIDLDGTIADYDTEMRAQMALIRAPDEPEFTHRPTYDEDVPSHITARRKMIQRQPGFWRNLKPLTQGFEIIEEMRRAGFGLHVLTKGPTSTPNAWNEKVEWCKVHLPDAAITISQDKSLVYGRVLFDDFPPYFEKWLAVRPRGLVICLAHPWNVEFGKGGPKEHANILRYEGEGDRSEVRERLSRAYSRAAKELL